MLGKLTKHEFLTVGRIALPTYIGVLLVATVGRFLTWLTSRQYLIDHVPATFVKIIKVLSSLISTVYVVAFIALIVMTIFLMVYRFYKNFFTDEGYLMNTLPVRPASLVTSKLFNSWIWIIFSLIVAFGSLYITLGHYDQLIDMFKNVGTAFKDVLDREGDFIRDELGVPIWVFVVELVFLALSYVTRYILTWYSSVGFGMLLSKKHKVLGTLIAYLILEIVSYILVGIYLAIAAKVVPNYYDIINTSGGKALQLVVVGSLVLNTIMSRLLFWFDCFIMKHRLNID